jgi:hypothetical protein
MENYHFQLGNNKFQLIPIFRCVVPGEEVGVTGYDMGVGVVKRACVVCQSNVSDLQNGVREAEVVTDGYCVRE